MAKPGRHVLRARVLGARGQLHRAIRHLRSIKGEIGPAIKQELGRLHHAAGQLEQSRFAFMDCLQQCPDDADTWLRLAVVCIGQGRMQQAAGACTQAISQQADNLERGDFAAAEQRLEQVLRLRPALADAWYKLVFIVGLPRSGANLLNQVSCAHSKVTTIGSNERAEQARQAVETRFSASIPYPDVVQSLNGEMIEKMSAGFLEGVRVADRLITDTTTSNFMNLGLLKLLFPAARVLHLTRNPRDLCLSMYFNDLGPWFAERVGLRPIPYPQERRGHHQQLVGQATVIQFVGGSLAKLQRSAWTPGKPATGAITLSGQITGADSQARF